MTSFFERIMQVAEFKGYNNPNIFAKKGLNWSSSEKINRLKDEKKSPSIDMIVDISNKFEDIDIKWLLTGKGNMLEKSFSELSNYIKDDISRYESPKHDKNSLKEIGFRLDEICRVKNINYQDLSELTNFDYVELVGIIAGNKPTPVSLLKKIIEMMPEISPIWLILGYGSLYKEVAENKDEEIKRLKQEIEELKKRTYSTENVDRKTA